MRTDQLKQYARLGFNLSHITQSQMERIERQFMLESKKDVINSVELDKYFTSLVILTNELLGELRQVTKMVLERE